MASFNGVDLGPFVTMQTAANPIALQINEYPGVNGLEILQQGSRGGTTHAQGACYGVDATALATTEQQFRTLQADGTVGNLIDTTGVTWPSVMLVEFQPVGQIEFITGFGWARSYNMTFLHGI